MSFKCPLCRKNDAGIEVFGYRGFVCVDCATNIQISQIQNWAVLGEEINISQINVIKKSIEHDSQNAELYFQLGCALIPDPIKTKEFGGNRIGEAFEAFLKASALGLKNHLSKARALRSLGFLSGKFIGKKDIMQTTGLDYNIYVQAQKSINNFQINAEGKSYLKKAVKEYNNALLFEPNNIPALKELASVFRALKDDEQEADIEIHVRELETKKTMGVTLEGIPRQATKSEKGIIFEQQCLLLLESLGFSAESTKNSADGGIDLIAISNQPLVGGRFIVQCKNWNKPVGEPVVRDLYGVVAAENAAKGILISKSGFTESARNFASGKRLELIGGDDLESLARKVTGK